MFSVAVSRFSQKSPSSRSGRRFKPFAQDRTCSLGQTSSHHLHSEQKQPYPTKKTCPNCHDHSIPGRSVREGSDHDAVVTMSPIFPRYSDA